MSSVYTLDREDTYYHIITKIEYDYAVALHAAKEQNNDSTTKIFTIEREELQRF